MEVPLFADIFSGLDRFSDLWLPSTMVFWSCSLYFFIFILSSSSYWMSSNYIQAIALGLLKFDPSKARTGQAFADPGFSGLVCSAWMLVGSAGTLGLSPYFNTMSREPTFIFTVTMVLWWNALLTHTSWSPSNLLAGAFVSSRKLLGSFFIFSLEAVSWVSRGLTFGGRFLASIYVGAFIGSIMSSSCSSSVGRLVIFFLPLVLWNFYEVFATIFQCYLIGLLGICFCSSRAFMSNTKKFSFKETLKKKRFSKNLYVKEMWANWHNGPPTMPDLWAALMWRMSGFNSPWWELFHESFSVAVMYAMLVSALGSFLLFVGASLGKKGRRRRQAFTAFECGFQAMASPRIPFSLKFYLISIIFLLFDVELVLIFPMFVSFDPRAEVMVYLFFCILLFGLLHECNEGSLEWKESNRGSKPKLRSSFQK